MILRLAQWSFLLLIFSLPFARPFSFSIRGFNIPLTDFIFVIAAAFTAVAIARREIDAKFDRVFLAVLLYAAVLTVTAFFPEANPVKLLGEYYLVGLCALTILHCRDRDFCRDVVMVWLAALAITSLLSVIGVGLYYAGMTTESDNYFLSRVGSLPAGYYPRIQSLFANPNMLCNYLNVSIPLMGFAYRQEWLSNGKAQGLAVLSLIAAVFTLSPGLGGIGLSLGLLGYVFMPGRKLPFAVLCAGIIIAAAVFSVTLISPDTDNTEQQVRLPFSQKVVEPSVRVLVWENVIERVADSPLLGRGIGSSPGQLKYETLSGEKQLLTDAHNMYLDVLGQAGLVGLACLLFLIILLLRKSHSYVRSGNELGIVLACAFVGAVVYQGLAGSFEDARHVWVLIGMLIAVSGIKAAGNDISQASTAP